jgi:DNA-binding NtrC family response regulator/tetratricopeptide (TPR) repeat protein
VRKRTIEDSIVYEVSAALRDAGSVFPSKSAAPSPGDALALRSSVPQVVADRFVRCEHTWIDLATADPVQLRIIPSGSRRDELDWNARCASLANLRHPLINALVDYGSIDRAHRFEAYELRPSIVLGKRAAQDAIAHAIRFIRAFDMRLSRSEANCVLRRIETGRSASPPTLGILLQHRHVFGVVGDTLEAASPAGVSTISIQGVIQSGLRTTRLVSARAARLHGYVPIAPAAIAAFRWLRDYVSGRHVCVLGTADATREPCVESLLTQLSLESARRHVVLRFDRPQPAPGSRTVTIERMEVTVMSRMVFIDSEQGPSAAEILAAARAADGRPGKCLERLGAGAYEPTRVDRFTVHELRPWYGSPPPLTGATKAASKEGRTSRVVRDAVNRSESLIARGRHSAAERVLSRALHVQTGRGASEDAARTAIRLGYLALDRGRIDRAVVNFQAARDAWPCSPLAAEAAIGLARAWIENGKLVDAEATLRTIAATCVENEYARVTASMALSRSLYWMGRLDEAMVALGAVKESAQLPDRARASALRSRILLAEGLIPAAVRCARLASEDAAAQPSLVVRAVAARALAAAVAAAGDDRAAAEYLADGLTAASRVRLPLLTARLRLTLAEVEAATHREHARRLVTRVIARKYPSLVQALARAVLSRIDGRDLDAPTKAFVAASGAVMLGRATIPSLANPVEDLESLLNLGHTATDDRSAIDGIAAAVHEKLRTTTIVVVAATDRRVLSVQGRPWHGEPQIAWQAAGGAGRVAVNISEEPCQAAEPVRYGGEIIGSIAARWTAGAAIDAVRASSQLQVAALALASHVRALLDRTLPPSTTPTWEDLLGESPLACGLREAIARAARAPFPVLIQGESGSGKELVARAIHKLGPRRDRRFSALNCAALSDELIEAELFGHARGAFTGAVGERAGLFEEADGGSLFLDEIGELSARAQAKLLRVLQDGEVRRVGENISRRVDVRIVAATNRRLEQEVAAGRFRADLRFRLDVVRIEVPPLRDRASDVPLLAARFWNEAADRVGSRATLTPDAMAALSRYEWPGNVRELQNVIAWVAVQSPRRGRIGQAALPAHVAQAGARQETTFEAARQEFERRFVKAALATADGRRARAAEMLGITRQGLAKMMRRLGIE